MSDKVILNTLEANELLREVHSHLDDPESAAWKRLTDFVMLSVEYIPELMEEFNKIVETLPYLLWFKEDGQTTTDMLEAAWAEFLKRFGKTPTFIMMNPNTQYDGELTTIKVTYSNAVLPGHVWLGIR
jgi:hypothetical protein